MEPPPTDLPPSLHPSAHIDGPGLGRLPNDEPLVGPGVTLPQENQPGPSALRPQSPQRRYPIPQHHPTPPIAHHLMLDHPPPDLPLNPASRPRTPLTKPITPRVGSPAHGHLPLSISQESVLPDGNRHPGERTLNVSDALTYLDEVKVQFADKPDVYNHFLDIMKDFKSQAIDTPGVIERVSTLFQGNPKLIQGFNTFLPPGYKIEISNDPRNLSGITVTTPQGILPHGGQFGGPIRIPREPPNNLLNAFPPQPFAAPPVLPVGLGPGSRPATPMMHNIPQHLPGYTDPVRPYSPNVQANIQAAAAANLLGRGPEERTQVEFNHAIQFLNKIKVRFSDEPDTYKQFLEILQNYQKESRQIQDQSHVFTQVALLFKNAPDLMNEFRDFLPEVTGPSQSQHGLMSIMPHPSGSSWNQNADSPSMDTDKPKPNRRRKRVADKEPAATQKAGGRAAKKAKTSHKPEPGSPKFTAYEHPGSPQPPSHTHASHSRQAPYSSSSHMNGNHTGPTAGGSVYGQNPQGELAFFDRVKKTLENGGMYEEFLKLLNLFTRDIINLDNLMDRADVFLDPELMRQFKDLMGWEERYSGIDNGPPGSLRTSAPDHMAAQFPDDGQGPSYRRLPESEIRLACSGRDELARSVLNDEWVSHPTWASEESGFIAHRKTQFEETLHRVEEERHDYQVHIDCMYRTIAVLTPLDARLEEMSPEERAAFRLKADLGGSCKAVYSKALRRIYGKEAGMEVMRGLQECPSVAVPVVLARVKQKYEEATRYQREWNRTWREIDCKNFYKALDSQGISFKATDKKSITTKSFVQEIEAEKSKQTKNRDVRGKTFYGSTGPQLQYEIRDGEVLQDVLKMVYSFLDHSHSTYSPSERRAVEKFLESFVQVLFTSSHHEFAPATGSIEFENGVDEPEPRGGRQSASGNHSTGVAAGDLRKRLLKTVQDNSPRRKKNKGSPSHSAGSASPMASGSPAVASKELGDTENNVRVRSNPEDVWIREFIGPSDERHIRAGETAVSSRPFYANTTFYTLLRLLQLLYSRLHACKEIGAQLAKGRHAFLKPNPVAVQLGLDDPSGPSVVLAQAIEAVGNPSASGDEPNVLYMYLLEACEKVFENELDQATFEEHMRWFFGSKAYQVFTLDRVITAIIKQVQTITSDNKCQELWELLQKARRGEMASIHELVRYRREAERNSGSDEHLYKVEWDTRSRTLRIQLLGSEDASVEEDESKIGRWRQYVGTFVTRYPTELLPQGRSSRAKAERSRLFLKRCLIDGDGADKDEVQETNGIGVCVDLSTYKLRYEGGSEDGLWRVRWGEEEELRSRASARASERSRTRWLR